LGLTKSQLEKIIIKEKKFDEKADNLNFQTKLEGETIPISHGYWLWWKVWFNKFPLFIREFSEFHSHLHNTITEDNIYRFDMGSC